jgi:DNA-directed RNA polymerase specialized sigma24 family protein
MSVSDNAKSQGPDTVGSITRWLPALKAGESEAIRAVWERYFRPLVGVAANRMNPARCRAAGPEDVACNAFLELCERLAREDGTERFPQLANREHLWKLLVCFTARAAFDHNTKEMRRAEIVAGGSALGEGAGAIAASEPAPEFAVAVAELIEQLADPKHPEQGEKLQLVAVLKMEGYEHTEIAARLGCSVKTIERKVALIRQIWKAWAPTASA